MAFKQAAAKAGRRVVKKAGEAMLDQVRKEVSTLKNQELFEGLAMPALVSAARGIALTKRSVPGKTLPVFSNSNRKVVIPTVSSGTTSTSVYGFKYNEKPIPRKTGDLTNQVRKNSQYTLTSAANLQRTVDIPLLSCADLSDGGTNNYTSVTYESLFETAFNVAGQNPTIALNLTARDQNRIILDRFESTLKVSNPTASAVEVTIYDLLPKRDVPLGTYVDRSYALGLQSPTYVWSSGLTNQVETESTFDITVLGAQPTNVLKFNTFWKVMKRTKIELSAGSTHIHRGCSILNTLFNYYDYSEVRGLRAMLCPTQMITISGMPTATELAASATINYSSECVLYGRSSVNDNITVRSYDSSIT